MVSRAEHRTATLLALSEAAISAMEDEGPDVPLERIAERAGVTRRTIYRWVATREDLVFIHPLLWFDAFDRGVEAAEADDLAHRVRSGAASVCAVIDRDPSPVLRSMHLAQAHPQLMRGYTAVSQQWVERMADEAVAAGVQDPFRASVIGAAIMGVIDAALHAWSTTVPTPELGPLVSEGLDLLEPILGHRSGLASGHE